MFAVQEGEKGWMGVWCLVNSSCLVYANNIDDVYLAGSTVKDNLVVP